MSPVVVAVLVVTAMLAGGAAGWAVLSLTSGQEQLGAVVPLSPADGERFDFFPRTLTLVWEPVDGATGYTLDIQLQSGGEWSTSFPGYHVEGLTTTSYQFDFVGAQPGRWRVTATGPEGAVGPPGPWTTFEFLQ